MKKNLLLITLTILINSCDSNTVNINTNNNFKSTPIPSIGPTDNAETKQQPEIQKMNLTQNLIIDKKDNLVLMFAQNNSYEIIDKDKSCNLINILDKKNIFLRCDEINEKINYKIINLQSKLTKNIFSTKDNNSFFVSMSPDNNWASFIEDKYTISLINIDSNEKISIPLSPENYTYSNEFSWSADSQDIVFVKDKNIYRYNIITKSESMITKYTSKDYLAYSFGILINSPRFSFDKKYIAYFNQGRIFVIDSDGKNNRMIGNSSGYNWSKIKNELYYTKPEGLMVYKADEDKEEIIVKNYKDFFLEQEKIISQENDKLYIMNFNGQQKKLLDIQTNSPINYILSPDGKKIIYTTNIVLITQAMFIQENRVHSGSGFQDAYIYDIEKDRTTYVFGGDYISTSFPRIDNISWSEDSKFLLYKLNSYKRTSPNYIHPIYQFYLYDTDKDSISELSEEKSLYTDNFDSKVLWF